MLQELSWAMTYEMLNSADTSSLKVEQQGTPAEWPFPSFPIAALLEVISTLVEPCSLEEQRETDRLGFICTEKNIGYIFGFFSASLMVILAPDERLGLFSLLLFGQSELCDESDSQALLHNGQVLCMPPLNHGTSHPWGITILWSAFLLKSAAWKDLMLRSKLISFRCSS